MALSIAVCIWFCVVFASIEKKFSSHLLNKVKCFVSYCLHLGVLEIKKFYSEKSKQP